MKRGLMIATVLAVLGSVSVLAASQVQTLSGAVMCRAAHNPTMYSAACFAPGVRYVFVSGRSVFDIKHQNFSGLGPLVGQPLRIVGEVKGHVVDILQVTELPSLDWPDDPR